MEKVVITRHGPPSVLRVQSAELPDPAANEVQIKVQYAGINFADLLMRMGLYPTAPKPPFSPGHELSGMVTKAGEGADQDLVGKPVIGMSHFGAYVSDINLHAERVFPLPSEDILKPAAAIPVNYLTAYVMMVVQTNLKKGEWLLVHGIGGGVGIAALQIAKILGANVIGTASAHKHDRLKAMGVEHLIDYHDTDFVKYAKDVTDGRGADVVLDPIGGSHLNRSFKAMGSFGRLVSYGFSTAAVSNKKRIFTLLKEFIAMPRFSPVKLMGTNKAVFGCHLGMLQKRETEMKLATDMLLKWYGEGLIKPEIDSVFPFSKAGEAHQYIHDHKNFGKVLLTPIE